MWSGALYTTFYQWFIDCNNICRIFGFHFLYIFFSSRRNTHTQHSRREYSQFFGKINICRERSIEANSLRATDSNAQIIFTFAEDREKCLLFCSRMSLLCSSHYTKKKLVLAAAVPIFDGVWQCRQLTSNTWFVNEQKKKPMANRDSNVGRRWLSLSRYQQKSMCKCARTQMQFRSCLMRAQSDQMWIYHIICSWDEICEPRRVRSHDNEN